LSALELAQRLQVNRRTIYRDVEFLSAQGVPIWQEDGVFGINRSGYLANVRLTYHEAMALVVAGLLLARILDEHNPYVIAALRRLSAALPEFPGQHLMRAATRIENLRQDPMRVAVLEAILEAWGKGRKVKIAYRSPTSGSLRERVLAPYALEPTASGLYVIGYDDWAGELRTFKLGRLESARMLAETYTIPEDFDPEAQRAASWGIMSGEQIQEVALRFTPAARPYVLERQWHPSQQVEESDDGGCLLRIWVSEPLEMQPWIRSWGAQVEVLAPNELRERIAVELRRAADLYAMQDTRQEFEVEDGPIVFPPPAPALSVQPAGASRVWPFLSFHEA
jgi:proteasome accessory factor B